MTSLRQLLITLFLAIFAIGIAPGLAQAVDADMDGYAAGVGPLDDCDDTNALIFPARDADMDGVTHPQSCTGAQNDCDDLDAYNFPGNTEVCDGQDNDCDVG